MYTLHGFSQSGNTFKVAFTLRALRQPFETRFVDFMHGVTRTGEWRAGVNEMSEVPGLDDGSRRLTQSGVILGYLADRHGQSAWVDRLRTLPGWGDPYRVLPGAVIAPRW